MSAILLLVRHSHIIAAKEMHRLPMRVLQQRYSLVFVATQLHDGDKIRKIL
tara:strand:+ start:1222 stop:1374 length:153 start_codon:yes stop_codon:yes gene_type:complete